jgi:predicted RNase H-like nuclease (RuvC/YqgF family)
MGYESSGDAEPGESQNKKRVAELEKMLKKKDKEIDTLKGRLAKMEAIVTDLGVSVHFGSDLQVSQEDSEA